MAGFGANIAIIHDGKILLTKREDFEVWCLPGGLTEPGESLAQTAIREAREETGYDVRLQRLVGVYSRLGGYNDLHGALFVGEISGGDLRPQAAEVIDTGWFTQEALPEATFWWHLQQINDALNGVGGSVASVAYLDPAEDAGSREEVYALRDASGMSREAFYRHYFGHDRERRGWHEVE